MIERYTLPEMGRIWTDEHRFQKWLEVEIAVLEVRAARGQVPIEAVTRIRDSAKFSVERIGEIEAQTHHDVIAFVTNVSEFLGDDGRYFHQGLTSSDVVDTAFSLLIKDAIDIVIQRTRDLATRVRDLAIQNKDVVMIGRTHGVHAEPTTFGLKLAIWYRELRRSLDRLRFARTQIGVGKISGAVGTYTIITPDMEQEILARLKLDADPISNQVVQRDRHAFCMSVLALTGTTLEKIAIEIRSLARTEIREVEEPFATGQKGSSAMPHKRNPICCERVCGLSRVVRSHMLAAFENVPLWHERDISHSSAERVIFPDAFTALHYMLDLMQRVFAGLVIYPDRMRENLESSRGLVYSGRVLTNLLGKGMSREEAYRVIQEESVYVWDHPGSSLLARLSERAEVGRYLHPDELQQSFEIGQFLTHVNESLGRALQDEQES